MTLIYTATGEKWLGERIGDVAHPWLKLRENWTPEKLAPLGLEVAPAPTPAPFVPTADDVRAEAGRRITERYPLYKQINLFRRAADDAERVAAETWIDAVRTASNELEGMDPVPANYATHEAWPE